ncbi:inositol polyphosphate phosphatase, putative [Leishmania tarentolae]|uniref:Inositol polyphosphate phosphatase, putative n=1 Tax=Leishmania tarentolae TaxID=5689 RepID=A0A640KGU4_LEITA|nr:inositol polyphosphate phosphatase, putative [Leishmania tarentolae]
MAATTSPFTLPRGRLPALQQLPLDSITAYDTATHCYLLGTDSMQKNFYLLSCRKHSPEQTLRHNAVSNSSDGFQYATAPESEVEAEGAGADTIASHAEPFGLDDLHDFTSYAVYSPTEAGALVDALRRENGASMRIFSAVAFLGAVRFTASYYLVLATEKRMAGYLGVHRLFEAVSVELVSLQLDPEWVAAAETQARQRLQQLRCGYSPFISTPETAADSSFRSSTSRTHSAMAGHGRPFAAFGAGASGSAATYLFQRRSLEALYRQQFITSLSRASSFFYSHSYDLTNTLQRNMLAAGAVTPGGAQTIPSAGNRGRRPDHVAAADGREESSQRNGQLLLPRMQYVWNEYLLEPWQLNDRDAESVDAEVSDVAEVDGRGGEAQASTPTGGSQRESAPQYPPALSRWRVFLVHGYITQRSVVVLQPSFRTLLITLIARVSKASAGVRYLRRGLNSDGHVANHVEVEQIISDESSWNSTFTVGALTSYVQLRGSVPVRWYHPPTASRLLPKPPIVIGPHDSQWSETCLHFQHLLEQYGAPILVHDLLQRRENSARESVLGDAYRTAVRAMVAAVDRYTATAAASTAGGDGAEKDDTSELRLCGADILRYESTDLRSLSQLAWNTMTAAAEQHFSAVRCFVCRPRYPTATSERHVQCASHRDPSDLLMTNDTCDVADAHDRCSRGDGEYAEVAQLQHGVIRSNCLDCIDRTNLGQLFHGLHALGEQLSALGLLQHAADVCDSPAVTEMLLEMYLAMGDAIATQYGGSAQVGVGVLHRGAGWDQLMGMKRLYHNVMGDRDKQEAMNLLLGRKQPQPRRDSRACNAEMHNPSQMTPLFLAQGSPSSTAPSLSTPVTYASPLAAAVLADASGVSLSREDAVAPPTSFFSGIRQTASRWWSAATSSTSSPGAAVAGAEAEAEADYYEQVSRAPRLPPVGLLTSWWVQPLRHYNEWYSACGASTLQRITRNNKTTGAASVQPLGEVATQKAPHTSLAHSDVVVSSPASAFASSTSSRVSMQTSTAVASAGAYDKDELALRLLAAETQALERWQLLIANVERQACLAPAQRDAATQLHHDTRREAWHNDGNDNIAAAPSLSSLFSPVSAGTSASNASAPSRTIQWPLVSSTTLSIMRTAAASGGGAAGAVSRAGYATVEAVELAPLPFSVPLLTVPLCLFTEPWVLLRTTTHVLPEESAAAAKRWLTRASTAPAAALCSGRGLQLGKKRASSMYGVDDALHQEPLHKVGQAVARQLFGCLPPAAAALVSRSRGQMPLEQHQPWRSPEEAHPHDAFPRIVRMSAFSQQDANLERLAYREMMWIVDGAGSAAAGVGGRSPKSLQRSTAHASIVYPSSPLRWPWTLSLQEVADRQFTAALLMDLFGSPATWGVEDIIRAMQRLVYPELVSVEVLEVLRSSHVQPPLEGAELLFTGAPARVGEGADEQERRVDAEVRQYWHERLVASDGQRGPLFTRSAAVAAFKQVSRPAPPGQASPVRVPSMTTQLPHQRNENVNAGNPVQAAVALLCHLASVLRFVVHDKVRGASVNGTDLGQVMMTCHDGVVAATAVAARWSHKAPTAENPGSAGVRSLAVSQSDAGTTHNEKTAHLRRVEEALLPLLEEYPNSSAAASACLPSLFPTHESLPDSLRRQWLLCRLLKPIFSRCALTPPTLHDLLSDFVSALLTDDDTATGRADDVDGNNEQRQQPRRREYRIRYSFVLPQQHWQLQQLLPQSPNPSLQSSGDDAADDTGGRGDGWYLYKLLMARPTALFSSSPLAPSSTHKGSSPATAVASRTLNIPTTLKVRHCCSALDLYRWSVAHRLLFVLPPEREPSCSSAASKKGCSVGRSTAAAVWHLLWWAVDNSFLIPVVRRRGQSTLEILADETALFCVKRDVARVALNVERRRRDGAWQPQQPGARPNAGKGVPSSSAIYGVDLVSSTLPLHRPFRRSALTSILTLSESLASLGLRAATQVQEFFRDRIMHGWVRQSLSAGAGTTVALFGGRAVGATEAVDSSPVSSTSGSASTVTAAAIVRRFYRLSHDCLQSVQSAMVALRHVSLDVFVRDANMHDHISFFVNVYNAAYVAAWLTNVMELVSNGAAAAAADTNSPGRSSHHQHQDAHRVPTPRTIDLFPLPTLCNTSYACFMHAYGVVIGDVFMSLEEMKYSILGGNRAPPHCDLPLWPPVGGNGASEGRPTSSQRSTELDWREQMQRLVPLHLRADVSEAARLSSLQRHPHLQQALDFSDMCEALASPTAHFHDTCTDEDGTHAPSATDSAKRSVRVSPSLLPRTSSAQGRVSQAGSGPQQRRRQELVDAWCVDVVRYLPFRVVLQLIDTYLPPPVLHLCASSVDAEWKESSVDVIGEDDGSGAEGGSSPALLDGRDRVPWYLQPIFNATPLLHTTLQSSKLGAAYAVARDGDGPAAGMLTPQVSQDANGVLLQPCRMWSSPPYYVVGGDGRNGDEAVSHSFQLLQALAGSYLGTGLYHPTTLGTTGSCAEDASPRAPAQHLCLPLHAGDAFTQLRATEAAFRSSLLTTDPHLFGGTATPPPSNKSPVVATMVRHSSQPVPLSLPTASSHPSHLRGRGGAASMHTSAAGSGFRLIFGNPGGFATSCSATLQNAIKPLLYEWYRSTEDELSNSTPPSRPGWQMRATLQMVRLLEESYASGRAVEAAQAAMQSG